MKSLLPIPMAIGLLLFIGCGNGERAEEIPAVEYATETITLETIKCQMCVAFVQQAAASVEGVEGMNIDFDRKIGTVSYNPDMTSLKDIEIAIATAGYHANETRRDEAAYANLPDCCR